MLSSDGRGLTLEASQPPVLKRIVQVGGLSTETPLQLEGRQRILNYRFGGAMARGRSGAIACGSRERWHVNKMPYPQALRGGSDSTRHPGWRIEGWPQGVVETAIA
jgi:hypothetical protein